LRQAAPMAETHAFSAVLTLPDNSENIDQSCCLMIAKLILKGAI